MENLYYQVSKTSSDADKSRERTILRNLVDGPVASADHEVQPHHSG